VSALLKLGMPTRISASPISLILALTSSLKITLSISCLLKNEEVYILKIFFVNKKIIALIP